MNNAVILNLLAICDCIRIGFPPNIKNTYQYALHSIEIASKTKLVCIHIHNISEYPILNQIHFQKYKTWLNISLNFKHKL